MAWLVIGILVVLCSFVVVLAAILNAKKIDDPNMDCDKWPDISNN